jgi:diketogulonate reductase-like aldo/keto reductase
MMKPGALMKLMKPGDTRTLSNGVNIPCLGFGTFSIGDDAGVSFAVKEAIALGYRHIDTAASYGNERAVGKGIRESGAAREDLFVTSKLANSMHGYENTRAAFKQSLADLGLDYLDLYLIHWPNPVMFRNRWQDANAETWRAFEELYGDGKIRALGVSNFRPRHLDALYQTAKIPPQVNQIRLCPGELPGEVIGDCERRNILIEAYSPLGRGAVLEAQALKEAAAAHGKSPAQVCLRWSLQHGFVPLPKSANPDRIRENAGIFGFELSPKEMAAIDAIEGCSGLSSDPDTTDF